MQKRHSGFTLIEILIVVIILGILAAIVIPQFTNASDDAKASSVASTVQSVRSQVELFKLQAGGAVPTADGTQRFWTTLMTTTTVDGKLVGPWVQAPPVNPFTAGSNVSLVVDAAAAAGTATDWCISSGKFYGNSRGVWIPKNQ